MRVLVDDKLFLRRYEITLSQTEAQSSSRHRGSRRLRCRHGGGL
jgi:hypothetical protein